VRVVLLCTERTIESHASDLARIEAGTYLIPEVLLGIDARMASAPLRL
jgi:hypothetical protein